MTIYWRVVLTTVLLRYEITNVAMLKYLDT